MPRLRLSTLLGASMHLRDYRLPLGLLVPVVILAPVAGRSAAAEAAPEGLEFFEKKVRPVLVEHCYSCHAGGKKKGSLSLESRAGLLKGGDNGPAILPGQPGKSRLV